MVFAQTVEFNVPKQHDFIVFLHEYRLQMSLGIILQSRDQLGVGAGDAVRRFDQTFAVRVFTDRDQQFPHGSFDARAVDFRIGQRVRRAQIVRVVIVIVVRRTDRSAGIQHVTSPDI